MTEDFDWKSLKSNQNAVKLEKNKNADVKTELPPLEEKVVESKKIKRNREVSDDTRHATWKEFEINLVKFSTDLAVLAQRFEEHLAVIEVITPELKTTILHLAKYIFSKNPKKNGIAKLAWEDAQTILTAFKEAPR